MPHDTRLGIIVGMVLVIAAAVLFFQREGEAQMPPSATVQAVASPAPVPVSLPTAHETAILPPVPEEPARPASRPRPAPIREVKHVH